MNRNSILTALVVALLSVTGTASAWTGTWTEMGRSAGTGDKARVVDWDGPGCLVCQSENRRSSTTCTDLATAKADGHVWHNGYSPTTNSWCDMSGAPGVVEIDSKGNVRFQ